MSITPRIPLSISLPASDVRDVDEVAVSLGFKSRGAYLLFLHRAMRSALELDPNERIVLANIFLWGRQNFRSTPSLKTLASICMLSQEFVEKCLLRFESRGWFQRLPSLDAPFAFDVAISWQERLELTAQGRLVAQAVSLGRASVVQQQPRRRAIR